MHSDLLNKELAGSMVDRSGVIWKDFNCMTQKLCILLLTPNFCLDGYEHLNSNKISLPDLTMENH